MPFSESQKPKTVALEPTGAKIKTTHQSVPYNSLKRLDFDPQRGQYCTNL